MRIVALPALAALALGVAACERRDAEAAIPRARFVAANVALRTVPDSAARADSLRRAALRRHRVTEKDLTGFVAAHRTDAEFMAEVWKEIAREVEKVHEARSREVAGRPGAPATMPVPPGAEPGPAMMPTPPTPPPATGRPPVPAAKPRVIRPDTMRPPTPPIEPPPPRDTRPWQPVPRPEDSIRVVPPAPPPPPPNR